jgi:hypothetical protein
VNESGTAVTQPNEKEQRLLRNARREGLLVLAVWVATIVWTMLAAYLLAYDRDTSQMRLILGMPDWVFWSVVLPWILCLAFSAWFCFRFMADDDLGQDQGDA